MPIDIQIHGRIKHKAKVQKYAEDIMTHYFNDNRLKRYVDIDIYMLTDLEGAEGYCYGNKDTIEIELARSNEFEKFTHKRMMESLAHELTHAKQYIRGEIKGTNMIWYSGGIREDCQDMDYYEQPWEKEAFAAEKILYGLYWRAS